MPLTKPEFINGLSFQPLFRATDISIFFHCSRQVLDLILHKSSIGPNWYTPIFIFKCIIIQLYFHSWISNLTDILYNGCYSDRSRLGNIKQQILGIFLKIFNSTRQTVKQTKFKSNIRRYLCFPFQWGIGYHREVGSSFWAILISQTI